MRVRYDKTQWHIREGDKGRKTLVASGAAYCAHSHGLSHGGDVSRSDVLWQPGLWVMKLILERRERRSGKCVTFITHHPLFPHFQPLSLCSARREVEKKGEKKRRAFCVNSLIRKTLTSIVPLHFGGKIFHWFSFAAIEGGQSWEGLCVGLHSAGGFQGRVGSSRGVSVCASGAVVVDGEVMSLLITPAPLLALRKNQLQPWSSSHHNSPLPPAPVVRSVPAGVLRQTCLFPLTHAYDESGSFTKHLDLASLLFVFSQAQEWWRMPMFFFSSKSTKIKYLSNVLFVIPQSKGTNIYISLVFFAELLQKRKEKKRKRP